MTGSRELHCCYSLNEHAVMNKKSMWEILDLSTGEVVKAGGWVEIVNFYCYID